jgi:hypothetical protein
MAAADAKAAAEAAEKAKFSRTTELFQRLGLHAYIPKLV